MPPTFPIRWNPVKVRITPLDIASTPIEPTFKAPVNRKKYGAPIDYNGQPSFASAMFQRTNPVLAGDQPKTGANSRIVFRIKDLAPYNPALVHPKKGDKVIALYVGTPNEQTVDLTIVEARYESPLRGVPLLLYCEIERDRERV